MTAVTLPGLPAGVDPVDPDAPFESVESGASVRYTLTQLALAIQLLLRDTDTTLAADSDLLFATQKAVKAAIASSISNIGLSGFRYKIELADTTASDPGAGLLKFNNATPSSASALYLDDSTFDGVDLSTLLGSLGSSGLLRITSVADVGEWRVFKWTATPTDNTGWWTFTVVDQAGTGTFEDDDEVQVLFLQIGASGVLSVATDTIWNAAGDIVQGTGSDTAARLPIGSAAQQLRVNSGATALEYFTPSAASPSVQSVTSSGTVTPTFSDDLVKITAQAAALDLANPSGTAVPGWGIVIRIKDNGTARAITYGTQYRAIGVTLPTTTVISKTLYLACIWNNDDTKLDVVAVGQEA